ncbi:phosphoribosyltransferase family protein [Anaeromyxobacter sp. SG26]|uniref:phosphoribosyltransferase family protein n=1 Tax=Anaeromyxobacter sp. SG26 TaxID=2925407 RepID=UPI001F564588|nr:phosphoribosyltransferase family protein [Anaeromyxobacter sp. SG26]
MVFRDREQAGRLLAEELGRLRAERPVVLGLTRGGVPVAFEVARALDAPLDVVVVRKIGAPGSPEYAIGAIAEGGAVFVRRDALREVGLTEADAAELAEREVVELARRVRRYRGDRPPAEVAGRTVIVVDDGVATGDDGVAPGATARAAARGARQRGAARVVLAAPVVAAASVAELRADFDEVIALELPEPFYAVGAWYERFDQVSDEQVVKSLRRARGEPAEGEVGELWNGEWTAPLGADPPGSEAEILSIPFDGPAGGPGVLEGELAVPDRALGLVLFVHGSGSTRRSPRNQLVARALRRAGLATLLFDLLTPPEAAEDEVTAELRFDIELLTGRVVSATRWIAALPRVRGLRLGYFGASTGAAAALAAAAELPELVGAVVSRGGRPDLVPAAVLERVRAPVLLVVGGRDSTVLRLNRSVLPHLRSAELTMVPGASHLFEEPGALESVARLAARWFERTFSAPAALTPPPFA